MSGGEAYPGGSACAYQIGLMQIYAYIHFFVNFESSPVT